RNVVLEKLAGLAEDAETLVGLLAAGGGEQRSRLLQRQDAGQCRVVAFLHLLQVFLGQVDVTLGPELAHEIQLALDRLLSAGRRAYKRQRKQTTENPFHRRPLRAEGESMQNGRAERH